MKSLPPEPLIRSILRKVRNVFCCLQRVYYRWCARDFCIHYPPANSPPEPQPLTPSHPLSEYFESNTEGNGIWKWEHYFDIYQEHFAPFVGKSLNLLEIGIYSGGSLPMWRHYFGDQCHVFGVDIEPACQAYANDHTTISIGDQGDRDFWKSFNQQHPPMDIIIDDGGHTPHQQRVSLECLLPRLTPGGIYVCEDIHGHYNGFSAYASLLGDQLHRHHREGTPSGWQQAIASIHTYPYCVVIKKHLTPLTRLHAPKMGTIWQPFYDH